jgi:hypothetical protein
MGVFNSTFEYILSKFLSQRFRIDAHQRNDPAPPHILHKAYKRACLPLVPMTTLRVLTCHTVHTHVQVGRSTQLRSGYQTKCQEHPVQPFVRRSHASIVSFQLSPRDTNIQTLT